MSAPKPTPNNLTLVKYGPLNVDFSVTGTYDLGNINYDENVFVPTNAFIVLTNALGGLSATPTVRIDNGTANDLIDVFPFSYIPIQTGPGNKGFSSQLTTPISGNRYILGGIPKSNSIPSNGAAATENIRINVSTAGIFATQTISRSTTNNISTLVIGNNTSISINATSLITGVSYVITFVGNTDFTLIGASSNTVGTVFLYNGGVQSGTGTVTLSNPIWAISGETVKINGVGNPAYNGTVTIASSDQYSFSYYNPSLSNESSTSDTGGTVGACFGDVYVTGYLF